MVVHLIHFGIIDVHIEATAVFRNGRLALFVLGEAEGLRNCFRH